MKVVDTKMVFEGKAFKNEKGETVAFLEITAKINGEPIRFSVKKEDKSLLHAMLRSVPEVK